MWPRIIAVPLAALNDAPPAHKQVRRGSVDAGEILPSATTHGLSMGAFSPSAGMEIRFRAAPLGSWWSLGVGLGEGSGAAARTAIRRTGGETAAAEWAVVSVGPVLALGFAAWPEQPNRPTVTMVA